MTEVNKWMLNRAGLLNFWYYDDEIFQFANGKLLLRGSNGSGKSVTMQSFLPVLLDGKKSPDRLDPFGSKARRMEDYLLGEKGVVDRDERTGYLFLEYKREQTNQYITTGIGLQAKRHKNMNFWGFVILDNRRIGVDFSLYKKERHGGETQKVPLSRIELENRIAKGGEVVRTQGDYMNLVNKHLFGFQSKESYEDLIKLLIQLRSPKLSKDFKPTVIYEILEAALPPLSDDDLRPLSDTIEHMDQTKQQLEQLQRENRSLNKLTRVYDQYNQYILAEKAEEALANRVKWEKTEQSFKDQLEKETEGVKEITKLESGLRDLEQSKEVTLQEQKRLSSHKVWNLEDELRGLNAQNGELQRDYEKKEKRMDEGRRRELDYRNEKDQKEGEWDVKSRVKKAVLNDLSQDAEEAGFPRHNINAGDFHRHEGARAFDFTLWKQEADGHYKRLNKAAGQIKDYENLKRQYQELNKDYADIIKEYDQLKYDENEWQKVFDEDKNKKEDEWHGWTKEYKALPVTEDVMQRASRAIRGLYDSASYDDVKQPFIDICQSYREELHKLLAGKKSEKTILEQTIAKLEEELSSWKNMTDPEPPTDPATKDARRKLEESGQAFLPFYAAVEFQDHVTQEQRERIESSLTHMGLLDALIADKSTVPEHDRIFRPNPQMMAHTLADYLRPDLSPNASVSLENVDRVLRSILIDDASAGSEGLVSIDESGRFIMSLIEGHAPPAKAAQFIGRTARGRYRKEKISELEMAVAEEKGELERLQAEIGQFEEKVKEVRDAQAAFPTDKDLVESFSQIRKKQLEIEQKVKERARMDERLKTMDYAFKKMKYEIDGQTAELDFPMTSTAYFEAAAMMRQYERDLGELVTTDLECRNLMRHIAQLNELIQHKAAEVDDIKGECNELEDRIKRTEMHIESIQEQLEKMGAEDIRRQIQDVQKRLASIEEELNSHRERLPRVQTELQYTREKLAALNEDRTFWENMYEAWIAAFEKESDRSFVEITQEDAIWKSAEAVKQNLGLFYEQHERAKVTEQLTKAYYSEQPDLMEYRLSEYEDRLKSLDWMDGKEWPDEKNVMIEKWKQLTARNVIEMDYQGQRVSPYFVKEAVEADINRNQDNLRENDRELYEEIILHSVGGMLRSRIQRAERWVKEMNRLMHKRNSSMGLTFSIKWKPRTAEAEEELDTHDLVELLRMNPRLLKESDLENVTRHFRSKIDRAKELIDDNSASNTLHQVLKEVLDYRKWFSFILSYKRENEPVRELTNHAFYQFSGGEKAMAMYIPLFTAAYSRYQEADEAAPYIISLDEAFAGVDEMNIRDMFEVVEELDFNYIMNSQALWGDYDTVSELSICELVRPKNADFVTVIHYHWDGHTRRYVDEMSRSENEEIAVSLVPDDE
ncbi:uncharacterized protein (TIGR02680 family) [Scopulibacillus darangshiensis]|uniref:Uncharacterized protein (TIGR02680 family) n=1 Tax=Scopulibacillus darangshiensis TaxID=442528 RepID=A0A4R2P575_9BACL|nr:TIGR02680 family protein [Scopulibacillus darangshiensis]TCP29990.1 uncharacterized protein (TIGR02680 family) [Scopulibacillus darangshiensis]